MNRFKDKVVIITGGVGGIGAATARMLSSEQAIVVVADVEGSRGEGVAKLMGATFQPMDVTSEADWKRVVRTTVERYGKIDVLINAAGIEGDVVNGTLESTTLSEWHRVLAVNLDGTFLGCREVAPVMKSTGYGAIVNLSSVGAYYPTIQSVSYGASKGAVTQLTKSVALHCSGQGKRIRCNSVHPGMIATGMLDRITSQLRARAVGTDAEAAARSVERMPMGGAGTPEDVARLIAFLASDEAAYITGAEFSVDGGWQLLR